jgi:quercetin dioxygenase-like cupin family protein
MAYRNKIIRNPKTGQKIRFLQTAKDSDGQLLEMEATFSPYSQEPKSHYHPIQEEDFKVVTGKLNVKLNGELIVLKAGDTLHISKNEVHAMWNEAKEKAVVNWKVRPALETEYLLETTMGLATDGKTDKDGMPNILQAAIMIKRFSNVFRLSKPSFLVQSIVFTLLEPIALLIGYKAVYPKYLD